ncbi:hypothetical protein FB446DRAFT_794729 [Lentinula raphanica]|nr:hypothetical protein FB446DRAFT_794729 [Lentinula raphanica]
MNTYPLELIAQLGPVMFVAGLNQANTTKTTKTTKPNQTKGKRTKTSVDSDTQGTIRRPPPAAAGHRKHQSMSDTMNMTGNMNPAMTPSSSSSSSATSSFSSPGPDAQTEAEREVQGEGDREMEDDDVEADIGQQRGDRGDRDPFTLLASRLREMLLAQRRITVWDPPSTVIATASTGTPGATAGGATTGAEEKKIFQVVLVDKDVRFPSRKALATTGGSAGAGDGDSSMSTSMSNAFPSSSCGLSMSSSHTSHTSEQ